MTQGFLLAKWKLKMRKNTLGSQTQDNHYSEDKARYKAITLTYPWCSGRTLLSNV
jgi:hypothetical protein